MGKLDDLTVPSFFNLSSDAVAIIDQKGQIHECNTAFHKLLQLPKSKIIYHNIQKLLPLYIQSKKIAARNYPLKATQISSLKSIPKYQAKIKEMNLNLTIRTTPMPHDSNKNLSFFIIHKLPPDRTINSEKIIQNMPNLLIALSPQLIIEQVNQATLTELGYSKKDIIGKPFSFICGKLHKKTLAQLQKTTAKKSISNIEVDFKTSSNLLKPALLTTTLNRINKRNIIICIATDISKHKLEEETLSQLAHNDFLTGLANRLALDTILQHEITVSSRHNRKIALLFIDLDQFKPVNDKLGHRIGDLLLIDVAGRLKQALRAEDFIARLSGDEFVVMLTDIKEEYTAGYIAEKIIKLISTPFTIEKHTINIGASIGIACYPSAGRDHTTLIKNADMAMYRAKKLGRNNCQFFTNEVNKSYLRRLNLEASLQQAFNEHEFNVVYQPIVNLQTQKIIGFEALLRWTNPTFNEIFPTEFIPIIEDAGMMLDLSRWLFCQVCEQYNHWSKTHTNLFINVNISEHQLFHSDFASSIAAICHHHHVDPSAIGLEMTETTIMSEPIYAAQRLKQLSQYGFKLYLDNFGTGYSSLKQIQHLPLNTLKIDKSFTLGLPLNESNAIVVKSIISLAESLNLSIIAEGIETEAQVKFFQENHCDIAQGFYFSKPKNAKQTEQLLTHKHLKQLFTQIANHHPRPAH